jgi:transcriptional regulator with XRE-family HTH domain
MATSAVNRAVAIAEGRQLAASGIARLVRQSAGLSLREVAHVIGIDPGTVWHWEHGSKVPSGANAIAYRDLIVALKDRQPQRSHPKQTAARGKQTGRPRREEVNT